VSDGFRTLAEGQKVEFEAVDEAAAGLAAPSFTQTLVSLTPSFLYSTTF
jgi:hypothetical protein